MAGLNNQDNTLAVIAITKNGASLACRIRESYPASVLYMPENFIPEGVKGVHPLGDDLGVDVARIFREHKGVVFVMATGIVVRLIAPLLKDKRTDPAVVVMDEAGRHVISLLSGHAGGANRLAGDIARAIGAVPVITTASDIRGAVAVDTLAETLGCVAEDYDAAKRVTAVAVNGGRIGIYSWLDKNILAGKIGTLPLGVELFDDLDCMARSALDASVLITPHLVPDDVLVGLGRVAFLRPRVLVAGMGCNRGTSEEELSNLFDQVLADNHLSASSVRNIATVEDKSDETGLLALASGRGLSINFISKEALLKSITPSGPSEKVFKNMGVYGVCEPAALVSAGARALLVKKTKSKNATMAVAEADW